MQIRSYAALFSLIVLGSMPAPALSRFLQDDEAVTSRKAVDEINASCLIRASEDPATLQTEVQGSDFPILAVARSLSGLQSKGFVTVDCDSVHLASPDQKLAYRDKVCELATMGNEAVQSQIGTAIGEDPSVLCANAEAIVGPWRAAQTSQ